MRVGPLLLLVQLGIWGLASPVWAGSLELDGVLKQGGVVFGKTAPGAEVRFEGRELMGATKAELMAVRGDRISMIFQ